MSEQLTFFDFKKIKNYMHAKPYRFLLLCSCFFMSQNGFSQVGFEAKTDAAQIVKDDYVDVVFTLYNGNMSSFQPPDFKGFENLRSSQGQNIEYRNGRATRSMSRTYTLRGNKIGKFTIGAAVAKVDGKTYRTKPLKIEVLPPGKKGTREKAIDRINNGTAILLRAEVDTTTIWLGQGVELDYTLYKSVDIQRLNLVNEPEYPGFYAVPIKQFPDQWRMKMMDEINYKYKPVKRVALFPQKTGLLEIQPMIIQISVRIDGQRGVHRSNIKSPVLKLNVKPLPEAGKPENFSGAIGTYDVRVTTGSNSMISLNEAYTIGITIYGAGDLKQIQAPELGLNAENFDLYEPKISEKVYESKGKISGTKTFEYVFLPKQTGRFEVAPSFSYFDTQLSEYVTKIPDTIAFRVVRGAAGAAATFDAIDEENQLKNQDILPIKTTTNLYTRGRGFFGSFPFWAMLVLPVLLFGGVVGYRQMLIKRGQIDPNLLRQQGAGKVAQERLATAKTHLDANRSRDFYDEISQALWGYVGDKLEIPLSELTKENVREKLSAHQVETTDTERFVALLNTCEMALFAGMDNAADMNKTYDEAASVITNIERETRDERQETRDGKQTVATILLLFFGSFLMAQPSFEAANQAYEKGNYNFAIEQYEGVLSTGQHAAELYYNLGNAYFKTGNLGKAILNYERTRSLAPRDAQARDNLAIAQARTIDIIQPLPDFFLTRWWRGLQQSLSAGLWSGLSILMLWLAVGGFSIWLLQTDREQKKRGFLGGMVCLLLFGITFALAAQRNSAQQNSKQAIVLAKETALKDAADEDSPDILTLHEGTKVGLVDQIGEWHKVRLPNGEQGWLVEGSFEEI